MGMPILCLDFDGVIHSYTSGWVTAAIINDPPVNGALEFIERALDHFEVHIYSSRSGQNGGIPAMREWLALWAGRSGHLDTRLHQIKWPTEKPPALVTIDDRALTFSGNWSDYPLDELAAFKPWNKR